MMDAITQARVKRDKRPAGAKAHAKETDDLPLNIQRRILRFVNAARVPEDLLRSPQRKRDTGDPHELMHEPGRNAAGDWTDTEHDDEHTHEHAHARGPKRGHTHAAKLKPEDKWAAIKLERKAAIDIIRRRPPLGYVHVRDIRDIDARVIGPWLDFLLEHLGKRWYGSWAEPIPIEISGVTYSIMNAAMLSSGKVLLIPSSTDTVLWNPNTSAFSLRNSAVTGLTADLFCSGHAFLSDGKLLVVGGGGAGIGEASSIEGWKFDPIAETWSKTANNMAYKRWYPTAVTVGDEPARVLVISGWMDGSPTTAPQMEIYSETTDSFTLVTATGPVGEKIGPQTYPGMHLLPGGEVFYAPVGFGDCGQNANPHSGTELSGFFTFTAIGAVTGFWTNTGANIRTKGMSALLLQGTYPFVQVLVVGGGTIAESGKARLINLSAMSPTWGPEFNLLHPRIHPNVVLLPDGKVFICGGMEETGTPPTGGPCELYDPVAGTVTEMDEVAYPRHYHSVALLLPSGQVMVAGGASAGGCTLSDFNTIEVYSPPYLFRGARPTISGSPESVEYGKNFKIDTPDADSIAKVVIVRPMAVTHQTDSEQRVVTLDFHRSSHDKITAKMPKKKLAHGLAPCGYYMLFILNANGVPSEARFIQLC
jgi:Galactose oxidase-like, Early set domain